MSINRLPVFDQISESLTRRIGVGLSRVCSVLRSEAWQAATLARLTPTQGQILSYLHWNRQKPAHLTALGDLLRTKLPTVSIAVEALVRKGLVAKVRSSSDARAIELSLTPKGEETAAHVAGWNDSLQVSVDTLTSEEQEIFLRCLIKIIRNLQKRNKISVSAMCATCEYFRPYAHSSPSQPHHCALVDAPFGDRHLRLECPDHEPASQEQMEAAWTSFVHPGK